LWPLAIAGIIAYLLDPLVDFFERRKIPRHRAIVLVFIIAAGIVLGIGVSVVPRLVFETRELASRVPGYAGADRRARERLDRERAFSLRTMAHSLTSRHSS
jgi:predicted PurR-regulated permease PerM